jgi:hypothetical protein
MYKAFTNSIFVSEKNSSGRREWEDDESVAFIGVYADLRLHHQGKLNKLFSKISISLATMNIIATDKQVENKWKSLHRAYTKAVQNNQKYSIKYSCLFLFIIIQQALFYVIYNITMIT